MLEYISGANIWDQPHLPHLCQRVDTPCSAHRISATYQPAGKLASFTLYDGSAYQVRVSSDCGCVPFDICTINF